MNTVPPAATWGPWEAELPACVWRLPRHSRSVGRARARFRSQAGRWDLAEETAETAVLLLSELVTNAVRHGHVRGRHIEVRCVLAPTVLRVDVSDAGRGVPVLRQAAAEDESGRGLTLVAALATTWGVLPRRHGIGKTVWCEISR
ncbi:Anti-sigma regulatory factor (Ser/Thr protein kinase) [Actinacidiphila rubida]|uniref:Anti-sigma regulatory factor (Ser/Thr protein kinase) n=2 Tax=Actinacidiphila rubida TaxID=310780 RepID=A0A1H8HTD2_9ACTN|nr:ATP-binding protein [Actinacidiphila rubida]SEN59374.1 Anti-sigma regulatory factor (Ser/Thr protein kinase) [Actinacidiphila rubida]